MKCLPIHQISRLGLTLSAENDSNHVFTKLAITIMADQARMESEHLSLRIKSGNPQPQGRRAPYRQDGRLPGDQGEAPGQA